MMKSFASRSLACVLVATAGLLAAKPANAETRLYELEHAILEVSCFKSNIAAVVSATVTPRDGTRMLSGSVRFSHYGELERIVSREFEPIDLPTVSSNYPLRIVGITAQGGFEDVNGGIYSFSGTSVKCSQFTL